MPTVLADVRPMPALSVVGAPPLHFDAALADGVAALANAVCYLGALTEPR